MYNDYAKLKIHDHPCDIKMMLEKDEIMQAGESWSGLFTER